MTIQSINPTTGALTTEYDEMQPEEREQRANMAVSAYADWRHAPFDERAEPMNELAGLLEGNLARLSTLASQEMGKPIEQARAEIKKCAWVCRYFAEHATEMLQEDAVQTEATRSSVRYQPLGPILAIMPWNFPFYQVFRAAAPAIMAGNTILLKHASNVPQIAVAIEDLFQMAGFPDGVLQTLLIRSPMVDDLIADTRVRGVTLTGGVAAGEEVGAAACSLVKKVVLELGGSDPFIVMPSADMDLAVERAVYGRIQNNGQSCIAAKRIIVHEEIADTFYDRFVEAMDDVRMGDPLAEDNDLGPLATDAVRDDLHRQVQESVEAGAHLVLGGELPDGPGFFYPPTVLIDLPDECPARSEELFGPVASVFRVEDMNEAIVLANETDYGLAASIWSQDEEEQHFIMNRLDAGVVFVNALPTSDPRLPFGGVKQSGVGRELGQHGIREFTNKQMVWVA